mmetsp:Transcript_104417/g.300912  ORF Transcript_104417/g.300912 Transcript_104417/m.300912 type:complete len:208 (-) Transcript_104417:221-844(-)
MPSTMMNGRRRRFGQTMLAATSQMRTTTMGAVTCHSPLRIMLERNVNCAQTHAARCCANQLAHQLPCAASSSCPSGHVTHSARFDAPSSTGEASIPSSKQVATHRRAASSMRKLAATQMIMVMNGEHHPRPTYDRSSCWKLVKSAHTLTLFLYRVTCLSVASTARRKSISSYSGCRSVGIRIPFCQVIFSTQAWLLTARTISRIASS